MLGLPVGEADLRPREVPLLLSVRSILDRVLKAVLFDVDFTLFRPGPELGPEGYRRVGERHGLVLDPGSVRRGAGECHRDAAAQSLARARRGGLDRVHRADRPRNGWRSERGARLRHRHGARVGAARELLALRGRVAGTRRAAAAQHSDRAHLERPAGPRRVHRAPRPRRRCRRRLEGARPHQAARVDLRRRAAAARGGARARP